MGPIAFPADAMGANSPTNSPEAQANQGVATLLWLIVFVEGVYILKSSLYTISSGDL